MAKPTTAQGYDPETTAHARATCLYVATKLGDLMDDLVLVGGLVPSLLIGGSGADDDRVAGAHVGTTDVDLGLALELLGTGLYSTLTERLRSAGFECDANDRGTPRGSGGGQARRTGEWASTFSCSRASRAIEAVGCGTSSQTLPPSSCRACTSRSRIRCPFR